MRRFDEIQPALTEDRVNLIAQAIRRGRQVGANVKADYGEYDVPFGVGCLSFDVTKAAIANLAQEHDWLEVRDPDLHFVFAINGVPLRFFRGDVDSPPRRHQRSLQAEVPPTQSAFDFVDDDALLSWRFVVEEPEIGGPARVYLAAYAGTVRRHVWLLDAAPAVLVDVSSHLPAVLEAEEADLELRPDEAAEEEVLPPLEDSDASE